MRPARSLASGVPPSFHYAVGEGEELFAERVEAFFAQELQDLSAGVTTKLYFSHLNRSRFAGGWLV
jgi:hypothetical protein